MKTHLVKTSIDICTDVIAWWLVGYAFAFGETKDGWIGSTNFAGTDMLLERTPDNYTFWVFQLVFAGTAATIVSGCILERMHITGYIVFAMTTIGWTYAVECHWAWGGGWLQTDY